MGKYSRVFIGTLSVVWGLGLAFFVLTWSGAAAPSPAGLSIQNGLAAAALQASCPVTTSITGQLDPATSPLQQGRLFRNGVASSCSGKAFPGLFNSGGLYRYNMLGPYENFGDQDACVVVTYNPFGAGGCGANAHLVAYRNAYDPTNQALNYLGDVGFSTAQPFSFTLPAGDSLMLVAQNTTNLIQGCSFSFTIAEVPCQSQPFIEAIPHSLNLTLLQETVLTETLTITNHGLPSLTWTITPPGAWADVIPATGATTANAINPVKVVFDARGLTAGTYNGSLTINHNDSTKPAIVIPVTMEVKPSVNLGVSITDSPDPVFAAQPLTYTLTVTNHGVSAATGVILTDTLPAGVDYGNSSPSQGTCNFASNKVVCTLGNLAVGNTAQVIVHLTAPDAAGPITSQAQVRGNETDPVPANNSASTTTAVIIPGDLGLTKLDTPDPVYAGSDLIYDLTVTNHGGSDISGVILTDTLPAGVGYISATPSQGTCSLSSGKVTCSLGTISPVESVTVSIAVMAPSEAGTLNNQAVVTGNDFDPNPSNNSTQASTTVLAKADLAVSQQAGPFPVEAGDTLTYTVTVSNLGPSTATGMTLINTLPVSVTYGSATPSQGSCVFDSAIVTCSLGSLAGGQSASVAIQVTTQMDGPQINVASVTANEFDPYLTNNTANAQVDVGVLLYTLYIPVVHKIP